MEKVGRAASTRCGTGFAVAVWVAAAFLSTAALSQDGGSAPAADGSSSSFTPKQAAQILSAGDRAFRAGEVGDALRTFTTIFNVFPTWWIPGAKLAVAMAESGAPMDDVIHQIRGLASMSPSGPWVPMVAVMAAGTRGAPEDVEFLKTMSRGALAEPPEEEPFLMRTHDADVRSRYALARALALETNGQQGMAVTEYRALIESRPFAIAPRIRLAALLAALGRQADADALLQEIEASSLMPSRIRTIREELVNNPTKNPVPN